MEDTLYLLEHKETRKKIGYAFIDNNTIVINFHKNDRLDCIVKKDEEAENAIYEKESKYAVLDKSDLSQSKAESAHIYLKYILRLNKLVNYLKISNWSRLGGSIENLFEGLNDNADTINAFKKNLLEDSLNFNN